MPPSMTVMTMTMVVTATVMMMIAVALYLPTYYGLVVVLRISTHSCV